MTPLNEILKKAKKLNKEEKYQEVIDLLTDELLATHNDVALHSEKATAHLKLGNGWALIDMADHVAELHSAWAREQYKTVIEHYRIISEEHPDDTSAYHRIAVAYQRLRQYERSIEYFEKIIDIAPTTEAFYGVGFAYGELKQYRKAIPFLSQAVDLSPDSAYTYNSLGNNHRNLEEYTQALEYYTKAIEIDPKYSYPYNGLGNVYKDLKDFDNAIKNYNKAIETDPKYATPYNGLGIIYKDLGDHDKGIECYNKAIEIDANYAHPYHGLGVIYKELKDYDKAIECYNKAIEIDPNFEYPYNGLGNTYQELKEYDKAIECYKKAMEIDAEFSYAYVGLGNVHLSLSEYDEAIENYSKAIAIKPGDDTAYYNRALTYKKANRHKESLADYIKYVELTKDNPDYYTSLAQSEIPELEKLIDSPDLSKLNALVDSIKKLLLFNGETVTHYTSLTVANILIITPDSSFLLSEGAYLNDTSEGRELFSYLSFQTSTKVSNDTIAELFAKKPFIGSFVSEQKHDDLTLWRMYGKENKEEAKGCAITLDKEMFLGNLKKKLVSGNEMRTGSKDNEEFNFYRVAYRMNDGKNSFILPGAKKDENKLNKYMAQLAEFIKTFNSKEDRPETDKQNVLELLNGIAYLFKSAEYQYEHELRLVVKGTGIPKEISADWPPRVRIKLVNINPILKKITLGPKVERADEWAAAFFYKLDKDGYSPEILISRLPFK